MCRSIGKIITSALKVLFIVYIIAWLEQILNRLIAWIVQKWKTRGIDPRHVSADEIEKYYMKNGIQCRRCGCWLPAGLIRCPICANTKQLKHF